MSKAYSITFEEHPDGRTVIRFFTGAREGIPENIICQEPQSQIEELVARCWWVLQIGAQTINTDPIPQPVEQRPAGELN